MFQTTVLPSGASSEAAFPLHPALPVIPSFSISLEWHPPINVQEIARRDSYLEELAIVQVAMEEKRQYKAHDICCLPKPLRKILGPERTRRTALKRRTPEKWVAEIRKLRGGLAFRSRVACLVWWDYFSRRTIAERWPHLDEYLAAPFVYFPIEDICRGLYAVGYTALQAHDRVGESYTKPDYIPVKERKDYAN